MPVPAAAVQQYQAQQQITVQTAQRVQRLWLGMGDEFDLSWSGIAPDVFATVVAGQVASAQLGASYVPAVVAAQGMDPAQAGLVDLNRFAGGTADGRPLESLLSGAVYESKAAVGRGVGSRAALASGGSWLSRAVMESVRDAGRQSVAANYTVTRAVTGWVRMLNPPSCKFCVMLAGKFFKWNQGFQAHPLCDCVHIPSKESRAGGLTVDPYKYFRSLGKSMQDKVWGAADAEAIRSGADIYRVTNVRMRGLSSDKAKQAVGHNIGWQARRYDSPSKMTIDDIFKAARGRDDAIRLMRENGFIIGEQRAGGIILGNGSVGAGGQMGRGGTRRGASDAYRAAMASGRRDLLDPATQTAAERRLHQAVLAKRAVDEGRNPFGSYSLGAADAAAVRRNYEREIRRLGSSVQSVRDLARLLHVL